MKVLFRILKYRTIVLATSLFAIAILAYFVPHFTDNLGGSTFTVDGSQGQQAQKLLNSRFKDFPSEQDVVVFHSDTLTVRDERYRELIARSQQSLLGKPHVKRITSPYAQDSESQISSDGHTALMIIDLEGSDGELQKNSVTLRDALPPPSNSVALYLTGSSPLNADVIEQESRDIEHADTIGLPIAFLVLLLAFGAVIAAGIPLLLGALGVTATFGLLGILSHVMHFDVFVESAVTMIGLALGIDYSLMIVTRFREELASGKQPMEAVNNTLSTAGKAVLFSGLTVLVSLSGLLLVNSPLFRGLAIGTMLTVGVMLTLCLTLLPIILGLLGHRINSLRIIGRKHQQDSERAFWASWARFVMRKPGIVAIVVVATLLVMAWPVYSLHLGLNMGTSTLKGQSSSKGLRLVEERFSAGVISPIQIVVSRDNGAFNDRDLSALANLHEELSRTDNVKAVSSLPQSLDMATGRHDATALSIAKENPGYFANLLNINQGSSVTVITVVPDMAADSSRATHLLSDIQNRVKPYLANNTDLHVGYIGTTAQIADLNAEVGRATPIVLTFVLGLSFVLLALTFRSIVLPVKAILMNLLALGAAFGMVVLLFQQGLGEQWLDFSSPGYIQNYLPLLTFVILFGLSMDYEVFLLSRMREEWLRTGDNTEAVAIGLEHTAKVITHAAAIMIMVFLSFLIAHMLEIKQLGFALAVAVFIDATLIRLLLVPAAMRLMGKWNWWAPKWMR